MALAKIRWRRTRGTVLGLAVGLVLLGGCRPNGRRALIEGDRHLQAGRAAEAVPLLERAAADLQTDGAAWNQLGRAYHELGRVGDARKAYLRALQSDRNLFDAHFNLGQLALESGSWREAEAGFRTWLGAGRGGTAAAGGAMAWRGLGIAQLRQGNVNEAERSFGSALRLDDKDAEAWNAVGLIKQQRRQYRDAFNTFAHAARLNPQFPAPLLNAAILAHQHLNDRRAALEYYRAYLALNPPDAPAISQLIAQLEPRVGAAAPSGPSPRPVEPAGGTVAAVPLVRPVSNPPPVRPSPAMAGPASPSNVPAKSRLGPTLAGPPPTSRPTAAASAEPTPAVSAPMVRRSGTPDRENPSTSQPTRFAPVVSAPLMVPAPVAPDTPKIPTASPPATIELVDSKPTPVAPTEIAETSSTPSTKAPLEVVRVEDRPVLRPANDPVPPPPLVESTVVLPPAASPVSTPEAPTPDAIPAPASTETALSPGTPGEDGEASSVSQPSLWAKANPVNWFKRERPPATPWSNGKPITPLEFPPSDPLPARTESSAPAASATVPPRRAPLRTIAALPAPRRAKAVPAPVVSPPLSKPKPVYPRYPRQVMQPPQSGDHAAAEREFQSALEAHRLQDLRTAMTGYQRVVALDPAYFEAQYNLALAAVARGDLPVALRAAETASVLRPTDTSARYQFAVALQRSHHPQDAVTELEEIARQQQTNAASHLAAAQLYANDLEDPDRARSHYQKVLALDPAHPESAAIRRWLAQNPAK